MHVPKQPQLNMTIFKYDYEQYCISKAYTTGIKNSA